MINIVFVDVKISLSNKRGMEIESCPFNTFKHKIIKGRENVKKIEI